MDRAVLETASDRYVVVEYLAEGGMGAIYLGKKLGVDGFEKEVVLKQLLPEYTSQPKFIDLFLREARISATLDHANIVRTVDLVHSGDDYFMVMEYVRGADLRTLLKRARRRRKRFGVHAAVFVAHELLEALAYAHGKTGPDGRPLGLIHRDISPSNVLVSGAGEVKLTDFGIAKAGTHRSVFYKVKGKVGYMSPEQARGEVVDARTDLFSLGVLLYETLVGERLFLGDLMTAVATVYGQKVVPPSRQRPEIPSDLDQVVLRAIALDPRARFQSAEEFQEVLTRTAGKHRLLCGASEMASHLRQVCGDDPSQWLKLENLGFDESQAIAQGTAVLSSAEAVDSIDDEAENDFEDSAPQQTRSRPASEFQKKELTSVIALRGDDVDILSDEASLPRRARPSDPLLASAEAAYADFEDEHGFMAPTTVRPPRTAEPKTPHPTPTPTPTIPTRTQRPAPSSHEAETVIREDLSGAGPAPVPGPVAAPQPAPARVEPRPAPAWPPPTQPPPTARAPGSPDTDHVPKPHALRRAIMLVALFLLVGVAVALGVAFSGPELEVHEPAGNPAPAR